MRIFIRRLITILVDAAIWSFSTLINIIFFVFGWKFVFFWGEVFGNLNYVVDRNKRAIIEEELQSLFKSRYDKREITAITRRSFVNYYTRHAESLFLGRLDKKKLDKVMTVEGLKNIDEALSKGNGVILLLAHFGSFLLPLPFLGYRGYKVNQIAGRQIHTSLLSERIWTWRKSEADKMPVNFIQVGEFLRPLYNSLKNNEIIAVAFDGREGTNWVETEFMGRKALFSSGPFLLARKTGAVIIPTFMIRTKDKTHRLLLEPAFKLSAQSDINSAIREDTQQFAGLFAKYVKEFPCHFGGVLGKVNLMHKNGKGLPLFVEGK